MTEVMTGTFHIWATYALVVMAVIGFASDRLKVEVTSLLLLTAMLLLFELFPINGAGGENPLDTASLLALFANSAFFPIFYLIIGSAVKRCRSLYLRSLA